MALGIYDEEDIRAIAESIRVNAFTSKTYTTKEMPNGVSEVFGAARQEGYDKGYPEGYEKGYEVGYCDAYAKGNDDGYITGEREGRIAAYNEVEPLNAELEQILYGEDTGGEGFYGEFWDEFQANGTRSNYENAFRNTCWTDKCYNPKYLFNTDRIGWMFMGCKITDTKVPIVHKGQTNATYVFYDALNMATIRSLTVDEKTTYSSWFTRTEALENITFEGVIGNDMDIHWSIKLTKDSIKSIINHLSSATSGKTVTLSKTAVNKAFEASVGANNGSTSEQWLNLIATKSNWTISLA